jgi:uncharacterized phiE125 gp8 family phage protein
MYATLAQLKAYLAITANTDDALLTDLLMRATSVIEQMTRKVFVATPASPRRFGRGQMLWEGTLHRDYLLLPSGYYVAQLVSAVDGDGATIPLSEIELPPDGPPYTILIRRGSRWCHNTQTAEITARWGYSISPPADIEHATIRLAAWMYRQRGTANDPDRPTVADGGLVLLPSALPDDVKQILERYRDVV